MSEVAEVKSGPTRAQVERLQREMLAMPQADLATEHFFIPGVYVRRVFRKAGTLIVGKIHKNPHLFVCAAGELLVSTDGGIDHIKAGDVIESLPGTKRVTYALTDAVGLTIHRTDETDLDKIEEELIEPEPQAAFDAWNKLKELT